MLPSTPVFLNASTYLERLQFWCLGFSVWVWVVGAKRRHLMKCAVFFKEEMILNRKLGSWEVLPSDQVITKMPIMAGTSGGMCTRTKTQNHK